MPNLNLTQAAAERLPLPPAGQPAVTHWDTNLRGFALRVSPKGRKTFVVQYRVRGGREVLETIGLLTLMTVAQARDAARESIRLARQGTDPVRSRQAASAAANAAAEAAAFTFEKLAARYVFEHCQVKTRASTASETTRLLRRASAAFGDKPVSAITKGDVIALVHGRRTGLAEQTNLLTVTRRCFRWGIAHDLINVDPSAGVLKPAQPSQRERVLSDEEIVKFWHACDAIGYPFGPAFKLLLLLGQRKMEVLGMTWEEINTEQRMWHLPGSRTKNHKAHDVPLSDQAMAIITSLPRFAAAPGRPSYLFSFTGKSPPTNDPAAKAKICDIMGVHDFTIHDIRRTTTTLMARLGTPPHVADRVLNHVSGSIQGVAAVYNRYQYLEERKVALDKLGAFIQRLVEPQDNVVALVRG